MSFDSLTSQTALVRRPVTTQSDTLTPSRIFSNVYTDMPCRLEQLTSREREIAGREGLEATHRLYYGPSYTLTQADRVTIETVVYEVEGVEAVRAASDIHHYETMVVLRS